MTAVKKGTNAAAITAGSEIEIIDINDKSI